MASAIAASERREHDTRDFDRVVQIVYLTRRPTEDGVGVVAIARPIEFDGYVHRHASPEVPIGAFRRDHLAMACRAAL
jgi:hypothetical protein